MAYLLLAPMPKPEVKKKYGLTSVWVHPNQSLLPFTLFISSGEDCYYTLVQINEDVQYLPLSNTTPISVLVDGDPGKSASGHVSQLEICQLLHAGGVVVYLGGLNGGLKLLCVTLPKIPHWETSSTQEDTHLQIVLPGTSQSRSPTAAPLQMSSPISPPIQWLNATVRWFPAAVWQRRSKTSYQTPYSRCLWGPLHTILPRDHCSHPAILSASKDQDLSKSGEVVLGHIKQPPPSPHESS